MKQILNLAAALLLATQMCSVIAATNTSEAPQRFFVSGVMKKNSDGVTVRLVHSMERAGSQQEALLVFTKKVAKQFPGYVLADALVLDANDTTNTAPEMPMAGIEI